MATRLERIGKTLAFTGAVVALVGCQVTYTDEKGKLIPPPVNAVAKAIVEQTAIYNDVENWDLPKDMKKIDNAEFKKNLLMMKQDFINFSDRYKIPPEVAPTIWYLTTGGKMENPTDGWGICGTKYIYAIGAKDKPNIQKGPVNKEQLFYQLNRCAEHFRNFASLDLNSQTVDFKLLGEAYAEYFGWNQFIPWLTNPNLANGWDGGVPVDDSQPLGALVIHTQINRLLFH